MKYGLIGEKLGHSFSVPIHNAFGNPEYELKEIPKDGLAAFMEAKDFAGINVTIPYKQAVMPYCKLDEAAKEIGAVNTIVNKDGVLYGYNTDAYGLSEMMDYALKGKDFRFEKKQAVILGAGGTAKTATYVLKQKGVAKITILARDVNKALEEMKGKGVFVESIASPSMDVLEKTEILLNTTPVGMYPKCDMLPIDPNLFQNLKCVFDVIYNPLTTKLVEIAKDKGTPCANGLYMLICQAKKAEELFGLLNETGEGESLKVYQKLRSGMADIVLTGMPGSGKSTLGGILAGKLNRPLYDTDEEFTKEYGITPGECITKEGEDAFRQKETEIVKKLSGYTGVILSTGGGVVTRKENMDALKQNGVIVYLRRSVESLSSEGRPLSMGEGRIAKLYEERKPLYEGYADFVIDVKEGSVEETAASVVKEYENFSD